MGLLRLFVWAAWGIVPLHLDNLTRCVTVDERSKKDACEHICMAIYIHICMYIYMCIYTYTYILLKYMNIHTVTVCVV